MSVATLDALEKRLKRLERELRWWRFGALGALILLIALGAAPRSTTLEAERLIIRDTKETVRAVLGNETEERGWSRLPYLPWSRLPFRWLPKAAPEAKFGLYLYTEQGVEASHLNVSPYGDPLLLLVDPQQRAVAAIYTNSGSALVSIAANMRTREEYVVAFEAAQKRAEREKWGDNDKRWKEAASVADGSLDLAANPGGKNRDLVPPGYRFEGSASSLGDFTLLPGRLTLFDKDGQSRAVLGRTGLEIIKTGTVEQRAESSLVLFDRNGKVLWQAP